MSKEITIKEFCEEEGIELKKESEEIKELGGESYTKTK